MYKRPFRFLSLILSLILLSQMLPLQVFAASANKADASEKITEAKPAHIVEELPGKRTEYSKEYRLSNGLHMAAVYPEPVHYEKDGKFVEIDNTLKLSGTSYVNTAGVWQVSFPQQMSKTNAVSITKDGYTLSFYMAGQLRSPGNLEVMSASAETLAIGSETFSIQSSQTASAQPQVIDLAKEKASAQHPETVADTIHSRLQYENIYANTNIVYDLVSNQVKESIIIDSYDAALRGYRYTLNTGDLIPVLTDSGDILLYGSDKKTVVMAMPAPFLVDEVGEYCYDVTVNLTQSGSGYTLTYTLPQSWLANTDRQWPVVLDPVVIADLDINNVRDRNVYERATASQTENKLQCGYDTEEGIMRFYIKYQELPVLSSSDVVVEATMKLKKMSTSVASTVVNVHKVESNWESETLTWANKPDYNETVEDFANVQNAGWYDWDVTDIVRDWYEVGNYGMMFKCTDELEAAGESSFRQFYSSDYSHYASTLPALAITFRNNNGLESYWDYTASSAGRAGTGYVNSYTGNLVWVRGDIGFGGSRMSVAVSHVYNANDSQNNAFGMGNGWRTNYNQLVYQWAEDSRYYVWEDSDGTDHYFYYDSTDKVYKDEDGLELTLTVKSSGTSRYILTDKSGGTSHFDSHGRLIKLENNQATKSSVNITYTTSSGKKISTVTDAVGRVYAFTYNSSGLLTRISYKSTGEREISYTAFSYNAAGDLASITDPDGKSSAYTYNADHLLRTASDIDGYRLEYTYTTPVNTWQPYRVLSIAEYDGTTAGGCLTIAYDHNQTTFTDVSGNVQILQFNNWGNTVSIQDGEGRAQYAAYAADTNPEGKANQLTLSSKLQNTVGNILNDSGYENSTTNVTGANQVIQATTEQAYYGSKSLKITTIAANAGSSTGSTTIPAGATYAFSAYVKADTGSAVLGIIVGNTTVKSQELPAGSGWTRLEVSYTNATSSPQSLITCALTPQPGIIYVDCVQLEEAPTASRYNLVENGDFRYGGTHWTASGGFSVTTGNAPAPELESAVYTVTGDPQAAKSASQTVQVSGSEGDTFVIGGWAKGNAVPLREEDREFGIRATFHYTDGETKEFVARFNPDVENWQYSATVMVAEKDYSSITVELAYDHNANTVSFDGIQLFKEAFGSSYTYDEDGNVISVTDLQKQVTTYEYDANQNLTGVNLPTGAKLTYTYDNYHNVLTATTEEGLKYEFTYDTYGNNIAVAIADGNSRISSSAAYTTDGNRLVSATDALGNITTYSYNADTNLLEWVQYPEDTEATRTEYTYDEMYRVASAAADTDSGLELSVAYTYTDDYLTAIQTPTTTYSFSQGDFGLSSSVKIGSRMLASYSYYENDRTYRLKQLTYGNSDSVTYTYDQQGRVTRETYEDGAFVTYDYDNSGALATVYDSESDISKTYYYDFTDRMMKYVESGDNYSLSVGYTYDAINNLTAMVETINGVAHTTSYIYDKDNRVTSITTDGTTETYTYDGFGRVSQKVTKNGKTTILTETYTYTTNANGSPTGQIATLHTQAVGYNVTYSYTYDNNGNILSISDGTHTTSYVYDSANQLIRENNEKADITRTWTYDDAGNILTEKAYPYTTEALDDAADTVSYNYDDTTAWGDLLIAYDGTAITHDEIGNPLTDGTWSYTWKHGRQLASMTDGASTWTYSYNSDGLRTSRANGTTAYNYIYSGSQLAQMTVDGNTLYFTYDASGTPQTVTYNGTTYYYATNIQGDIVAILDSTGTAVVTYTYDAWGAHLSGTNGTGSDASTLGRYNPLRYRGYVFDAETGLYYLQSRYYNPATRRFINADVYVSTGQGFIGNNMFTYCLNNPIVLYDTTGKNPMLTPLGPLVLIPETMENIRKSNYLYDHDPEDLFSEHLETHRNITKKEAVAFYNTIAAGDYGQLVGSSIASSFFNIIPFGEYLALLFGFSSELADAAESNRVYDRKGRLLYIEEGYTVVTINRVYIGNSHSATETQYIIYDEDGVIVYNDVISTTYITD